MRVMQGALKGTVLLAEAEPSVAQVVTSRLDSEGVQVRWVRTVRETRSELAANPPDLLVLDTALETDGLEFFQALRTRPEAPRGGVVLITPQGDTHARERAHQLGAAAVVSKPVKVDDVTRVVLELLDCL
jgi:DNA-binding response OmpR family regulator